MRALRRSCSGNGRSGLANKGGGSDSLKSVAEWHDCKHSSERRSSLSSGSVELVSLRVEDQSGCRAHTIQRARACPRCSLAAWSFDPLSSRSPHFGVARVAHARWPLSERLQRTAGRQR